MNAENVCLWKIEDTSVPRLIRGWCGETEIDCILFISMHYRQQVHDAKPTKCPKLFLRYLYYSIAIKSLTNFGPQGTIIRESNQSSSSQNQNIAIALL
jgi:hypothetical protein